MAGKKIKEEDIEKIKIQEIKTETNPDIETSVQKPKNNINYSVFFIIALIVIAGIIFFILKQKSMVDDSEIAVINGKVIMLSELNKLYSSMPSEYKATVTKKNLLSQLIESEVLYQEAQKDGVTVNKEEAENYILLAKTSSGLTEEQFAEKLKEQQTTEEELKQQYAKQLTIKAFLNKNLIEKVLISDSEIKKYYSDNKEQFKVGEQVTVRHILIGDKDLSLEQQEEKAKSLLPKITKDNFCDFVKEYSTDTASIEKCGEYTFTKDDPLAQEFKDFSFKQSSGKIGTVKTDFGVHIILTIKKIPSKTIPLKEAAEKIRETLKLQKAKDGYKQFYEELAQKSNIEIKYNEKTTNQ